MYVHSSLKNKINVTLLLCLLGLSCCIYVTVYGKGEVAFKGTWGKVELWMCVKKALKCLFIFYGLVCGFLRQGQKQCEEMCVTLLRSSPNAHQHLL